MIERSTPLLFAKSIARFFAGAIEDYIWKSNVFFQTLTLNRTSKLHLVTGADFSHSVALENLLVSIRRFEPKATVTVWDLGLLVEQRNRLSSEFPLYTFRDFNFGLYPDHVNIRKDAGQYSWKPIAVSLSVDSRAPLTLWLDAGNIITSPLKLVRRILVKRGFFSPYSSGTIADWTHKGSLSFLGASEAIGQEPNCNGAVVGFDIRNIQAADLLIKWTNCAMDKDCIAPGGSNRLNHRQDQAVLSVLASMNEINALRAERIMRKPLGILIHQDPVGY